MVERMEWNRTADLLVALLEPQRDEEKRPDPYIRATFHPMLDEKTELEKQKTKRPMITVEDLALGMFNLPAPNFRKL